MTERNTDRTRSTHDSADSFSGKRSAQDKHAPRAASAARSRSTAKTTPAHSVHGTRVRGGARKDAEANGFWFMKKSGADSSKSKKTSSEKSEGSGNTGGLLKNLNPKTKKIIIGVAVGVLGLVVVLCGIDLAIAHGKIHPGVSVNGIDVGGLTRAEAAEKLETTLSAELSSSTVSIYADEEAEATAVAAQSEESSETSTTDDSGESSSDDESESTDGVWSIAADTVGATVDGDELAGEAMSVGREGNVVLDRIKAWFGGIDVAATVSYDDELLTSIMQVITDTIGSPAVNSDIEIEDGEVTVVSGSNGEEVDASTFETALTTALLTSDHEFIVTMAVDKIQITDSIAAATAEIVQDAIADSVTLTYEDESWEFSSSELGSWVATKAEKNEEGTWSLTPYIDEEVATDAIDEELGDAVGTEAVDASFKISGGEVTIVESENGTGPDTDAALDEINTLLFGSGLTSRTIELQTVDVEPDITTEDAKAMGVTDCIATYTTSYSASNTARVTNIHRLCDLLDGSLVASGDTWSFNDTTGERTAAKGFQEAGAIVDGELVNQLGGGICQVATTVFNAVFESGLTVVERSNHSQYISHYPTGRDAAVSWTSPDLKFKNDTDAYVLVIATYTSSTVTISLWGTDPGYTVESKVGEWKKGSDYDTEEVEDSTLAAGETEVVQEGVDGKKITVTRYVYDEDGELLHTDKFTSVYDAVDEIINVGTKKTTTTSTESSSTASD